MKKEDKGLIIEKIAETLKGYSSGTVQDSHLIP